MTMRGKDERETQVCPYLHELATDFVCIYPQTVYCVGAEHGKPRFPSRATAQKYCAGNFAECEGFRRRCLQIP
jgi:hypothetical protein